MTSYMIAIALFIIIIAAIYSVIPNILVRWFRWQTMTRGPATNSVALTFDDGPDANYTTQLLDVLKRHDIRATFFVIVDKAVRHPDIMTRMIADGHEVEVHGLTHAMVPLLGPLGSLAQVQVSSTMLQEKYGITTRLYRPTWGLCNLVWFVASSRSHRLVTWSIMVGDWRLTPPGVLLHRIMRRLHPGAVIVLHDSDETWGSEKGAPARVVELMPQLAEAVRREGYSFVTLSEWDTLQQDG